MTFRLTSLCVAGLLGACATTSAATPQHPFGRPLIPDLVADASIVEVNGVFYCYATTDGWGKHLSTSGTPVVWTSRDFVNWSFEGSIYPDNFNAKYWAPSAPFKHDGRYYLFPTLDGQITATVSDSLTGPFKTLDGKDIFPGSGWQAFPIEQKSAIDAEIFRDDDGQTYMFYSRGETQARSLRPRRADYRRRHRRDRLLRRPVDFQTQGNLLLPLHSRRR